MVNQLRCITSIHHGESIKRSSMLDDINQKHLFGSLELSVFIGYNKILTGPYAYE